MNLSEQEFCLMLRYTLAAIIISILYLDNNLNSYTIAGVIAGLILPGTHMVGGNDETNKNARSRLSISGQG